MRNRISREVYRRDNLKPTPIPFEQLWAKYKHAHRGMYKKDRITNKKEFRKVVLDIFRRISYYWTNSTGGVYMKGLGYFSIIRPKVNTKLMTERDFSNYLQLKGYKYVPFHETSFRYGDSILGFTIQQPSIVVSNSLKINIRQHRRYTYNKYIIKEFLKNRTNI